MEKIHSDNDAKCYQNDLTSRKNNNYVDTKTKWKLRKSRRKLMTLYWTCFLYFTLPVPQNAMPVPKVENNNSLTSAMVSIYFGFIFFIGFYINYRIHI